MTTLSPPLSVLYCGQCGNPPEYCSFGPDFKTHCKPWLVQTWPAVARKLGHLAPLSDDKPPTAAAAGAPTDKAPAPPSPPPTEPWSIPTRLTKFYEKYMPSKTSDVPKLLVKYSGKEDALFAALTKKYGDEPLDPFLAAKWGITENDAESGDDGDSDGDGAVDNHTAVDEASRQLSGMRMAQAAAAKKVTGGVPEGDEAENDDSDGGGKKKARGVAVKAVKKVTTRVLIQKHARQKKKAVTVVIGMDTVPTIKMKEAAKAFAKRFAGSSSVKKDAAGREEIVIQGDHQEECARMIVEKFGVRKECVFLDIDGEFVGVV